MDMRKNYSIDFSIEKFNNEIIKVPLDLNLHKEITALSRELENIDKIKSQLSSSSSFVNKPSDLDPEQNYRALGLHNTTERMLKKIDPLIKQQGYIHFIEGYHKTLQELKIKFLLKSIIENPMDWEDYDLCCEIYDGTIGYYQSARCTLNQCDLIYQNITLKNIQRFLAVFKYNFAYNLTYKTIRAPADVNNFHYYSVLRGFSAQGLDEDLCHTLTNLSNALRIAQESYRESETRGEKKDPLLIYLIEKRRVYGERVPNTSANIGAG
ncbi:hypothetical protein [Sodalis sp. dw_96]|uniref:hypothetical protein n=1 Tax=Sodalis sp. dw_96 TaxID=2719794 RepID=UPI001BD2702B|nr:hypothetical protein [Sodalis sp. dw_96]